MTLQGPLAFSAYFKAIHGYEPFPWQQRLAASIVELGVWPNLLDVPTGLGKTSTIDIALFVLAVRPDIAPRRTILVVDRRVVVDQAATHARKIQQRLNEAKDGILAEVAASLRALWQGTADSAPFEVAVLRGGMPRDEAWAQRPDRPVVALSTVDQVGSRLLFRGYGVSPGMSPVHAGLLGHDALILLDEVQLSTAFAETLRAVDERWRPWRERAPAPSNGASQVPDRWAFVRMSATPIGEPSKSDVRFGLDGKDLAHKEVVKRRTAKKMALLAAPIVTNKNDAEKTDRAVIEAFSREAMKHLGQGARRVAVIVNRVRTARLIHEELKRQAGASGDVVLLTGRMRPLDRVDVFGSADEPNSIANRVVAGSDRDPQHRPVILVSTQTIEAGADFDFDALVTECASIDALRQRFGRLDRRGDQGAAEATILIRKDQAANSEDDPVYGGALGRTWTWLEAQAGTSRTVDFGISGFPALPDDLSSLCSPIKHAPVLLPAHLDAWSQTNPRGEPDPDIALWLHGPQRGNAEVRVVWRADIEEAALRDSARENAVEEYATASLAVAPPSSLESISVPLAAFRDWIANGGKTNQPAPDFSDLEGAETASEGRRDRQESDEKGRPFLLVTKSGAEVHRNTGQIFPEATLVVPASYGGIRDGNWNPDATEPVSDLGDVAQFLHRGRPVLRLAPPVVNAKGVSNGAHSVAIEPASAPAVPTAPADDDSDFDATRAVRDWLGETRALGSRLRQVIVDSLLASGRRLRIVPLAESSFFAALGKRQTPEQLAAFQQGLDGTSDIVNDDDDTASYIGREVALEDHLEDVDRWVRSFAKNLHLPEDLISDLALSARLHDIGKADPRFQQMLNGGSPVRAAASNRLLAKSRGDAGDRLAQQQARERSGYPTGYRHELLSVAMLQTNADALRRASDPELVLHLIGSHHGWCRPFAPPVHHGPPLSVSFSWNGETYAADTAHGLASFDSGIAERFWTLTERYGWWTLAWFEALVRLADHRASEESSRRATKSEFNEKVRSPNG
ncbi:MAG: type I-U CRISPR-associated helicase/endonuclease Cas3 [Pseudomonadota bacterium]